MQRPSRIASPVNRTPSFEIAITTSPPLSPPLPESDNLHHQRPPIASPRSDISTPAPPPHSYSPRRNVHETILREVREYHMQRSPLPAAPVLPLSPPSIHISAPIAEPESTTSFHTTPEEVEEDDGNFDEDDIEHDISERGVDLHIQAPLPPPPETPKPEDNQLDLTHSLEQPQDRPIIFPITPFYRRKGCSIWLGALCALFFLLSIALFLVWVITTDGFRTIGSKATNTCNTRQCIDMAFRMSSSIDEIIQPCENFYQYSCQRFNAQTADKQMSFLSQLKDNSLRIMHGLLSSDDNSLTPMPKSAKMARSLYEQCMNAVQRSANAPSDLLEFIRNFPCGPLLRDCQNFNADSYSWQRHSGMLDWYAGTYNLINYGRDVHPQDRSKIVLQIKPPVLDTILGPVIQNLMELASPSSTEFEPLLQLSLRQNVLSAFARDHLLRDPRDVQSQLDEVARLLVDLHQATRTSSRITPNTTYMTFKEFFQAMPELYFREYLDASLSNTYKWTEDDTLSIEDYDYFARLVDIMATTSRQAVANYLVTVTTYNMQQYSYSPRDQFGWRECVEQLSQLEISNKMFVEKSGKDIDVQKTSELLQSLKTDFISTHRSTPLQYLSTINRLGFYIGYPKRLLNEELVWKSVSQISLNQTDYFNSIIRVAKAERDYSLSQIGTYLDVDDTTEFPITTPSMLYNRHVGAIVIPLAFLEPPIYLPGDEVPMYGVYSSLGVTVLQMVSKIFWQGLDKTAQLECLNNLFRGFLDANRQRAANIEPQLLSTIELADAFKTAAFSYAKWQNDHHIHREKSLPAFESTDSMRSYMLSFSTLFCSGEGAEPGSDYEAMINTVVSNSRMFSIHFDCSNSTRLFNRRTCL